MGFARSVIELGLMIMICYTFYRMLQVEQRVGSLESSYCTGVDDDDVLSEDPSTRADLITPDDLTTKEEKLKKLTWQALADMASENGIPTTTPTGRKLTKPKLIEKIISLN